MPSVLLVSDDCVLGRGLAQVLEVESLEMIGCVSLEHTAATLKTENPTIVLIDMTGSVPLSAIADLRKSSPECHICLWARQISDELAYQAMTLGIRGILRRALPVTDLLTCLSKLARNEVWFEERLMGGFFSNHVVRLTRRESQLVALLAQGMKNKEIAYALSLSEGTVKVYLSRLFEKLSVKDRFELALYGLRNLNTDRHGSETPQPRGSFEDVKLSFVVARPGSSAAAAGRFAK